MQINGYKILQLFLKKGFSLLFAYIEIQHDIDQQIFLVLIIDLQIDYLLEKMRKIQKQVLLKLFFHSHYNDKYMLEGAYQNVFLKNLLNL